MRYNWSYVEVNEPMYAYVRLFVYLKRRIICVNAAADADAKFIYLMPRRGDGTR